MRHYKQTLFMHPDPQLQIDTVSKTLLVDISGDLFGGLYISIIWGSIYIYMLKHMALS